MALFERCKMLYGTTQGTNKLPCLYLGNFHVIKRDRQWSPCTSVITTVLGDFQQDVKMTREVYFVI